MVQTSIKKSIKIRMSFLMVFGSILDQFCFQNGGKLAPKSKKNQSKKQAHVEDDLRSVFLSIWDPFGSQNGALLGMILEFF